MNIYKYDIFYITIFISETDCQRQSHNSPGFDPSILRHSGILGAADEAVLTNVLKKIIKKK